MNIKPALLMCLIYDQNVGKCHLRALSNVIARVAKSFILYCARDLMI